MSEHPDSDLAVAHQLADAARPCALAHFRKSDLSADNKDAVGGYDPVTAGDREAEAAMRGVLSQVRPDDGIVGEEFGASDGTSGRYWVLDPIDGTRAFLIGAPTWGVLIALNDGAAPVIGVLDQPHTGERFWAGAAGAWFGRGDDPQAKPAPLTTRACDSLSDALLATTYPEVGSSQEREAFARVAGQAKLTRYGMDCYAYGLVAMGQLDLVIEAGLAPYDIQALIPIVERAGGVVTDWEGGDAQNGGRVIAAGSRALHAQALELLGD